MKFFIILFFMLFSLPALAQEKEIPAPCKILPPHKTDSNVGAAYVGGVDVHGNPVVGADVNAGPSPMAMTESMIVPLSFDLAQRLQGMNIQGLDLKATLGFLEISPDGRVKYNNTDITPQIYAACDKKPSDSEPSTGGHAEDVPLQYPPVKETKPAE